MCVYNWWIIHILTTTHLIKTLFFLTSCCYWSQVLKPCVTTVYWTLASDYSFTSSAALTWFCHLSLDLLSLLSECKTASLHWLQLCLRALWSLPSRPLYKCAPLTLIVVGLLSQTHSLCLKSLCVLTRSTNFAFILAADFLNVFYNTTLSTQFFGTLLDDCRSWRRHIWAIDTKMTRQWVCWG